MAFADLQSFIRELENRGQLKRVATEVDPVLEITEIADRVSKMAAGTTDAETHRERLDTQTRRQGDKESYGEQPGTQTPIHGEGGQLLHGAQGPWTDPVHGGYGGCGLLFESVKGAALPVAINLYGSYERVCLGWGVTTLNSWRSGLRNWSGRNCLLPCWKK